MATRHGRVAIYGAVAGSECDSDARVNEFSRMYGRVDCDVLHDTDEYESVRLSYSAPDLEEWEEAHMYSRRIAYAA